jgi:hypothetical protein
MFASCDSISASAVCVSQRPVRPSRRDSPPALQGGVIRTIRLVVLAVVMLSSGCARHTDVRPRCGAHEYPAGAGGGCLLYTECTEDEYEAIPPTATSDRECRPLPLLTNITPSSGTLEPFFDPAETEYSVSVGLFVQDFHLTLEAHPEDAVVTVDGTPVEFGVPSSPISLALGPTTITVEVSSADALARRVYTLTVHRAPAVQAYLKASNTGAVDVFGYSVSLDGDTLAVGAPQEDSGATGVNGNEADDSATDSGAVYVFTRSGSSWAQQAYLKASNTGAGDNFGWSVSLYGDSLAVTALSEDSSATGVDGDETND